MKHFIESEKLGKIGEEYDAEAAAATGVNVDALIAGGFISVQKAPKSAKTKSDPEEK
jgi:hypothetical protein